MREREGTLQAKRSYHKTPLISLFSNIMRDDVIRPISFVLLPFTLAMSSSLCRSLFLSPLSSTFLNVPSLSHHSCRSASSSSKVTSEKYCLELVRKSDLNHYAALLLLPPPIRRNVMAIRAFNVEVGWDWMCDIEIVYVCLMWCGSGEERDLT